MNTNLSIFWSTLLAFFGSCAPALLFNINRKRVFWAGIAGAIGWLSYCFVFHLNGNAYIATFVGAFFLNCYSEIIARIQKAPALMFYIPALFPLVPGYTAYITVLNVVQANYKTALLKGLETVGIGIAICFGIMISVAIMRTIIPYYYKKKSAIKARHGELK